MPRYPLAGINKLSQLGIDVDKDWNSKGITNIKELAASMTTGDLLVRGAGGILVRLPPDTANLVLTSGGPGVLPSWQPGGTYLNRYFPVDINLSQAAAVAAINHSSNKSAPIATLLRKNYVDDAANYIRRLSAALSLTDAETITTVDHNQNEGPVIGSEGGAQLLIAGAVADDGGVETDETAAARNVTANDMTLLPAVPAVGDAYMLGSTVKANRFHINIGTAGAGNWTLQMFYWNGAWSACVDEVETSAQFMASGLKYWQHTPQGDWALHVVQGMNLYWVRIEVVNYVNVVTQPLGNQSWSEILA